MNDYITIKANGTYEIEIKKSRFICSLFRITSESQAKEQIHRIKKEHWKANHNCSAFVLGERNEIQRSSDDGEPSGTAGVPMLEVLKKQEISNVLAVVTRYFGGTKLGAGGLIRAYTHAVSEGISQIGLVKGVLQKEINVTLSYSLLSKLEHFIEHSNYFIKKIDYAQDVNVYCLVQHEQVKTFESDIINLLNNQCSLKIGSEVYTEIPL